MTWRKNGSHPLTEAVGGGESKYWHKDRGTTDGRNQTTEDSGQKTESRGQTTAKRQRDDGRPLADARWDDVIIAKRS
jgi:hypothetical protein